jgi:exopolyphosphatase/guanosine-5'-triphosphate,3'-diphosphate pyrophosphatase
MSSATTSIARRISPAGATSGAGAAPRDSLRLAAIDVGSNSIHMIVGQADADGGVTTLWRMKEPVGLGRMSFPSRRLSKVAMDSAIATLARFKQAALQRGAEKIVAVATSAVREATNGGDLMERARRELGIFIRIVSARDEARLIYLGVRHAMTLKKPHLIVDIGGGSVEFIVGDERRALLLESRKLGAARMTARFVHTDPLSKSDRQALCRHYERELAPMFKTIAGLKPISAIGTSGTLENIAAMCGSSPQPSSNGHGMHHGVIERRKFEDLLKDIVRSDAKARSKMRGLDDQRRDQIVAGAMLVGEIFARLHLKRMTICPSALREGILLDYLSRHLPDLAIRREIPDPRRRSILDLARRCDWHKTHSEQVTAICLRLFDELRPLHKLGAAERELIEYASMLHDIGWHIASKGHHKHSMYLIANGALKEFTEEEVQIIANIARYHRKSPPNRKHEAYATLPASARRTVDVGAALLRIADGLDRSHTSVVTNLTCRIDDDRVKCVLSTRADAELEIWGARRKMDWFEKVFGREITFAFAKK